MIDISQIFELEEVKRKLSDKDYFATHHLSKSSLEAIHKSPLAFWDANINPEKPPKTSNNEQSIGTAFHLAILEPDNFDKEVVAMPKVDRRTKAGKAEYAEFMEEHGDSIVLDALDYDTVRYMRDAVYKHSGAMEYINDIKDVELSLFYKLDGVPLRSRIDAVGSDWLMDLKTTRDASKVGFNREVNKYSYYSQDALYSIAYKLAMNEPTKDFIFLAIEKTPPYGIGLYTLDASQRQYGLNRILKAIQTYKDCQSTNVWPDYNDGSTVNLSAPTWMMDSLNADIAEVA